MRKHYSLGMWTLCVEAADRIENLQKELSETREALARNTEALRQRITDSSGKIVTKEPK